MTETCGKGVQRGEWRRQQIEGMENRGEVGIDSDLALVYHIRT